MKLLFISNIGGKKVSNFSLSSRMAAKELGIEFHIACNFSMSDQQMREEEKHHGIKLHHIDFMRTPFHPANLKAYKQLLALMHMEKFDVVHCNTPVGGVIGRLCARKARIGKVIYMSHGFHFYKGAPLKNWLLFFPAEWIMARLTDSLLTINKEDFNRAKHFRLRNNGRVYQVPGVGINTSKIVLATSKRDDLLKELNIDEEAVLLLSAGELNKNKNNEVIIKAMKRLQNPRIHYILCGDGERKDQLISLAKKNNLDKNVHFLGYRSDIPQLLKSSDIFVLSSYREGLPRSIMEAMSAGLPCVVSKIRGNTNLIDDGQGGFLRAPNDFWGFSEAINQLVKNPEIRKNMGQYNQNKIKIFDCENVKKVMQSIYNEIIC